MEPGPGSSRCFGENIKIPIFFRPRNFSESRFSVLSAFSVKFSLKLKVSWKFDPLTYSKKLWIALRGGGREGNVRTTRQEKREGEREGRRCRWELGESEREMLWNMKEERVEWERKWGRCKCERNREREREKERNRERESEKWEWESSNIEIKNINVKF